MHSLSTPLAGSFAPRPVLLKRVSDARLVRLAAAGSEAACAEIFERYHQPLHRYCYSILGNGHDAADALQNTMVKALRSLPGEQREIALRPWLYRIAHNESITLLRARRSDADLDAAAAVGDAAAASLLESRHDLRELTQDLAELSERQRAALLMRELADLEFSDVAVALDTTPAAAKQSVYEARCALAAMREGRAMSCDEIRRALSDADRRVLRGARIRGHLRACAGCRDFEAALRARPSQLAAAFPPLPLAAAAAMLHGVVGIGGGGGGAGGGLTAGVAGGAKATTGLTLGVKAAAVVAATAALGGGAAYVVPAVRDATGAPPRSGIAVPNATPAADRSTRARAGTATTAARAAAHPAKRRSETAAANQPSHTAQAPATSAPSTSHAAAAGRPATKAAHATAASARGRSAAKAAHGRAVAAKRRKPVKLPSRRVPAKPSTSPAVVAPAHAAAPKVQPPEPLTAGGATPAPAAGPPVTPGGGRP